jgi:hypothetical protein
VEGDQEKGRARAAGIKPMRAQASPTISGESRTVKTSAFKGIQIKKSENASRSWGSPGNNYKTSAKYDILIDGVLRGKLWAQGKICYMDKPVWEILHFDAAGIIRPLKTIWHGGKKAAVAWIVANGEKF